MWFVQPFVVGWLTYRIMVYDALALHADVEERQTLSHSIALRFC